MTHSPPHLEEDLASRIEGDRPENDLPQLQEDEADEVIILDENDKGKQKLQPKTAALALARR